MTDLCRSFHAPQQLSVDSAGKLVNFNLINIQGLISQEQNKRYLIDEFAGLKGAKGKIVAITESHLQKGHHTKAEILKDLPGYSLARSDRDVDHDNESLDKCGGTLLIASNDLMMKEVGEYCFSNGSCELTTAELPEKDFYSSYLPSIREKFLYGKIQGNNEKSGGISKKVENREARV